MLFYLCCVSEGDGKRNILDSAEQRVCPKLVIHYKSGTNPQFFSLISDLAVLSRVQGIYERKHTLLSEYQPFT